MVIVLADRFSNPLRAAGMIYPGKASRHAQRIDLSTPKQIH